MRKSAKIHICNKLGCKNEAYLGGLCKKHYEEKQEQEKLVEEASALILKRCLDRKMLTQSTLKHDLEIIADYWRKAARSFQSNCEDDFFRGEEEYALAWCENWAKTIIQFERRYRETGLICQEEYRAEIEHYAERFDNLEKGLTSNGLKRD